MYRTPRGKFKPDLWNRPVCTDDSEPRRLRQMAKRDYEVDAWDEDEEDKCPPPAASSDFLGEVWELRVYPRSPSPLSTGERGAYGTVS